MAPGSLPNTAKQNVEIVARREQQLFGQRSRMERMGNAIACFFGNLKFVLAHGLFFSGWIALNLGMFSEVPPFDPYPFSLLGLVVGIEFIFLTTFVLMNQNFQSRRQDHWAHLTVQLSMLTEQEVTKNVQMLQAICKQLGIEPSEEHEVKDLAQKTPVGMLIDEIGQQLNNANKSVR